MSTYDDHREHLIVQYTEPVQSTRPTTHDLATARVTVEAPPTAIGDTQIYAGKEFVYTGSKWIPLIDEDDDANDDNEVL
jgi:hypothetical protein